jgi:hypothetical protein
LPDFITSAKRELMDSAVFFTFLIGAMWASAREECFFVDFYRGLDPVALFDENRF